MKENKVVELKKEEVVAEETANEKKVAPSEETMKRGFMDGAKMIAKPVGKALMYIGVGALTVFGVFAVLGIAPSLGEGEAIDTVENEDGSFTMKEAAEPQSEGSSEE